MNNGYEFHIDPLGQQPGLWNLYTQLTFCYPLPDPSASPRVVTTLRRGLENLTTAFPWIAGQVVQQFDQSKDSPYYVIRSYEKTPRLVIKHFEDELPDFETFEQSYFPVRLLDENLIAPRNTKSLSDDSEPKPVFLLQVTFITGGLLITFAAQHGTMDIVGQAEMIKYLSHACHDIPFTDEEILLGNCDRRTIISPLCRSEVDVSSNDNRAPQTADPKPSSTTKPPPSSSPSNLPASIKNIWANFIFSSTSLKDLKSSATTTIPTSSPTHFITTDDALSALIWKCISKSRLPHILHPTSDPSTFARAIDLRRFLNIPATYPGNLATKIYTKYTIQHLIDEPLGVISSRLRESINPENLSHEARRVVTTSPPSQHTSKDNNNNKENKNEPQTPQKPPRDLSKDIALSSWSKIGSTCYDLDFNLGLGSPRAIRRPSFTPAGEEQPMEGVVYLLPKRPDFSTDGRDGKNGKDGNGGEIVVMICLREDDMERLCGLEEWREYAEFIG